MNNLRTIIEKSNGWIVENLKQYGNTVIPNDLVEGKWVHGDLENLGRLLTLITGEKIKIRKVEEKVDALHINGKVSKDIFYIAESGTLLE